MGGADIHCLDAGDVDTEELRMTDCKHNWIPVEGQPLYKCARCGAFMRIIK